MFKYQIYLIGVLLFPGHAYANCYIDIGKGHTSGNVTLQEIQNGSSEFRELDKSGSTESISIGCPVSKGISISIEYLEFSEDFDLFGSAIESDSKSFSLSTSFEVYQFEKLNISVGAGYGRWESKTIIPQARWDFTLTPVTLFIEDKTHSSDGYTPYAHINLFHSFNRSLSLGFKFSYYHELGYVEPIIDYDALSTGDIAGALKVGSPKNSSVEIYSIHLRWSF